MAKHFKDVKKTAEDVDAKIAGVLAELDAAKQDARVEIAAALAMAENPEATPEEVQIAHERLAELRHAMDEGEGMKQILLRQRNHMLTNLTEAEHTARTKGELD